MNVNQLKQRSVAAVFGAVLVISGCHKKVVPPPAPPPPPPPAPTASITARPSAIQQGQSTTLSWTTANASLVTINGIGAVSASGSRDVTPTQSTDYTLTATATGGASVQASTRVTVTAPPPPPVAAAPVITDEELFAQNMHDVFFDYDKYDLRAEDTATAEADASFLKSHPGMKVLIEGHCDDRGSEEYNLTLGQSRAETLKKALINDGVDASRVRIISYGEEKPFCTEETESCWQQNRRDHVKLDR